MIYLLQNVQNNLKIQGFVNAMVINTARN